LPGTNAKKVSNGRGQQKVARPSFPDKKKTELVTSIGEGSFPGWNMLLKESAGESKKNREGERQGIWRTLFDMGPQSFGGECW